MKYNKDAIEKINQENLNAALELLASLPVAEGRKPTTKELSGWVYEQTIRHCLCEELKELEITTTVEEQVTLHGKTTVDLLVGKVAVEIKALGIFSNNDAQKYRKYRVKAEENGWSYFYVTRSESYHPYRAAMQSTFGDERAFFLDTEGDWERFVSEIIRNYD